MQGLAGCGAHSSRSLALRRVVSVEPSVRMRMILPGLDECRIFELGPKELSALTMSISS
jgi:hypothetical protein